MRIIPAILAGGAGTRLWPVSNENTPKQLLRLLGDKSLLQETILRLFDRDIDEYLADFYILTNSRYLSHIKSDLTEITTRNYNCIVEPFSRNTAPAIAAFVAQQFSSRVRDDEIICVLPCDHYFDNAAKFRSALLAAAREAIHGAIVTLGVKPTSANCGFGYIRPDNPSSKCSHIASFHEKPDAQTAQAWYSSGKYLWNCGIFVARLDVLRQAFQSYTPRLWELATSAGDVNQSNHELHLNPDAYNEIISASFDVAIMEKTDNAKVIPLDADWVDLGTWDAVYQQVKKTHTTNKITGLSEISHKCLSKPNLIVGHDKDVRIIGLNGLAVINSDELLIIASNDKLNEIENLREEYSEPTSTHANFAKKIRDWLHETLSKYSPPTEDTSPHMRDRPYTEARLIYVYCHAAVNFNKIYRPRALKLWQSFKLPWQKGYDPNSDDRTAYDIAHSLLACAWAYKAFDKTEIKKTGNEILHFLDTYFADGISGGYHERCKLIDGVSLSMVGQRGCDSQMHLLEAFLAWYQTTNEPIWLKKAEQIVEIFSARLFLEEWHCVAENYNQDFELFDQDPEQNQVKIGHMYEWIWLLYQYQVCTGHDITPLCRKLFSFANTWGTNPKTSLVYDANSVTGNVVTDTSRCWPQAERLKAHMAVYEMGIVSRIEPVMAQANLIFSRYINAAQTGPWIDKIAKDGTIIDARPAPSSLYHLYGCYFEYLKHNKIHSFEKQGNATLIRSQTTG